MIWRMLIGVRVTQREECAYGEWRVCMTGPPAQLLFCVPDPDLPPSTLDPHLLQNLQRLGCLLGAVEHLGLHGQGLATRGMHVQDLQHIHHKLVREKRIGVGMGITTAKGHVRHKSPLDERRRVTWFEATYVLDEAQGLLDGVLLRVLKDFPDLVPTAQS